MKDESFLFLGQKSTFFIKKFARACTYKKIVVYLHDFWNRIESFQFENHGIYT